nr:hypothetical protein CFP56_54047 [Quercus suber]
MARRQARASKYATNVDSGASVDMVAYATPSQSRTKILIPANLKALNTAALKFTLKTPSFGGRHYSSTGGEDLSSSSSYAAKNSYSSLLARELMLAIGCASHPKKSSFLLFQRHQADTTKISFQKFICTCNK